MIRIFVSSTFRDFAKERNLLAEQVFPELEEKCRENGFSFQAIDLRWGISQQNAMDNQTLKICIDEIARCRKLSPRPNFLILSGRRYGWIPLPCSIPSEEWDLMMAHAPQAEKSRAFLGRWYWQDFNDKKKEYLLQPRTGAYVDEGVWQAEEERLKEELFSLAKASLPENALVRYGLSATEQEIYHGLFWADDGCDHKLVVLMEGEEKELEKKIMENRLSRKDLVETKRLQDHLRGFSSYEKRPNMIRYDDKKIFPVEEIKAHFLKIIEEEIESTKQMTPYEQECAMVASEIQNVRKTYMDIAENEMEFQAFIDGNRGKSVLVTGESGSGKSMMLKHWYWENEGHGAAVFADVQPECRSVLHAVWFLAMELKRKGFLEEVEAMPEPETCVDWLKRHLSHVPGNRPVTVILDSVNHMDDWGELFGSFFEMELPPSVTLIISCFSRESLSKKEQEMEIPEYGMKLLKKESGLKMLEDKLLAKGRCLNFDEGVMKGLVCKGATPLYIQLLSDICMRVHSYDSPDVLPEAKDAKALIRFLVEKRSAGTYSVMYHHILGYLVLAGEGLSEQELLDILAMDQEVCAEIKQQTEWDFREKIPSALWVRIFVEIQDFLMEAESNGILLYRFRHMLIHQEIRSMLGEATLRRLALNLKDYFKMQKLTWRGQAGELVLNHRKLREYEPILSYLSAWGELGNLLEDPVYSDAMVRAGKYRELLLQFRKLEHHGGTSAGHRRIFRTLQQRPILFQTWTDSLRQVFFGEGIVENPEFLTEAGKEYVLLNRKTGGKSRDKAQEIPLETMFLAESSSKTMALRDDGVIAVLADGNVQIVDWKLRTPLQTVCRIGTDYMELYWRGTTLIARGEYCRAILEFTGKELYVVKQESCPAFADLMRDEGAEKKIGRAGGPRETDVIFPARSLSFCYFHGKNLERTELYYPYKSAFAVYFQGCFAAVVVDAKHVEIVDLDRRVVLHTWDLPAVSRIYWEESGRQILISFTDNRIAVFPVDHGLKGTPIPVSDGKGPFREDRQRAMLFVEDFQNTMDHVVRPTWKGDKPIRSETDEHLPVLAAFSAKKNWIAYYYNRHNHAIVRLFSLDSRELMTTEYVDPVFNKDTIEPAFYGAEDGNKLVLISAGKSHVWDIQTLRWKHCGKGQVDHDGKAHLAEKTGRLLQKEYPEIMKKWYPLKKAENQFAYEKSMKDHLIDGLIRIFSGFAKLMFWYIDFGKGMDASELLREQLGKLPAYEMGEFIVVPNAAMGLLHVCDRQGNWVAHEQFGQPFRAIDIVGSEIYILMKDSSTPIVMELDAVGKITGTR